MYLVYSKEIERNDRLVLQYRLNDDGIDDENNETKN